MSSIRVGGLFLGVVLNAARSLPADVVTYIEKASTWKYFRGLTEATTPDAGAWRGQGFDDSSWAGGAAPFGYGDGPYGTDLSRLSPPMRSNYSTLFLRRSFQVADPSRVVGLELSANYDDGFVAWVNGVEVLRVNVPGSRGDPVARDGLASGEHEQGPFVPFDLPAPAAYLAAGTNVLAVQVFNSLLTSSDLTFEAELYDPEGPDVNPPVLAGVVPGAGSTVRRLSRIELLFDEEVAGVEAADLLIGGRAATGVLGAGKGPYLFTFDEPDPGPVAVSFRDGHGIEDLANPPNRFAGASWSFTLDPAAPLPALVLSELLAANGRGLKDEDQDPSDWIEIQNLGGTPVDLAGYSLTDDLDDPGKWAFPAVVLDPQEIVVVFASGKDRKPTAGGNLHTNFQLNTAGEYLGLYSAESPRSVISEFHPAFPEQRTDHSYGLDPGGVRVYFPAPTPGAPNGGGLRFPGFAAPPLVSVPRGFYAGPLEVALSSPTAGAAIRYTLDGREPTEAAGTLYGGPVLLSPSPGKAVFPLRAASFKDGLLPSRTVTSTYLFPGEVPRQPANPPGFPTTWGNVSTIPADYAMDPIVVNSPDYSALVAGGLTAIPSVSIAMSLDDLFGRTRGIYSNASLSGPAWERAASVELLVPEGLPAPGGAGGFQIDCGIRVQGGSSTQGWKSLKLSLRLLFKEDYGYSKLREALFGAARAREFDTLLLDAGLNLTYNHPGHDQRVRSQYVRDQYVSDLQNAVGSLGPEGMLAHLYLNGLYWGLYVLHERPDASFNAEYRGGDKSQYDVIKHQGSQVEEGNGQAWGQMMALARGPVSTRPQYEALQAYLDVRDLIDYMIVNFYVGNDDWPHHNWYAGRRRTALPGGAAGEAGTPGARFRFFSWDAEHVLKDVAINLTGITNTESPAELYSRLRANPEFRLLFADRVQRHFSPGGPLHVDPASPAWDPDHPERNAPAARYVRRIRESDPAIVCESARWGDVRRPGQPYTRNVEWQAELNWLLNQYFPRRSANVLAQFRAAALVPAMGAPVLSRPGGTIEPGQVLELALPAGTTGTIHYTVDGSDPRQSWTGQVAPGARTYTAPLTLTGRTLVKARTFSGTAWSAVSEALYSLESSLDALRVSEIMYHPPGGRGEEFLELTNTGGTPLDLSGLGFAEGIAFTFPPDTTLEPGEFLVLAADLAGFEARYPAAAAPEGPYGGSLDNGGERLTLVDARGGVVLAIEYDDERSWPIGPDGFGHSLVAADPAAGGSAAADWRQSALPGGSPGRDDPAPPHQGVVVSEVLTRAAPPLEDAIELENLTGAFIQVGGWYLSDRRDDAGSLRKFRLPAGAVIPPHGRMVFYEAQLNPGPGTPAGFSLDERGGAVYLSAADAADNLTGYITGLEFPGAEAGVSLGRHPTSVGDDSGPLAFHTFGADAPSTLTEFRSGQGAPNSSPRVGPLVLNEVHYHPAVGDVEFIEIHNLTSAAVPLHDAARGRGWQVDGLLRGDGAGPYEFGPGVSVPAGGYLLLVAMDPALFRAQEGIPPGVPVVGPPGGALDNAGERLKLLRPTAAGGEVFHVLVDEVRYRSESPWPTLPDGGGPSLERKRPHDHGNDPANWDASAQAGGTPGARNTASPPPGSNLPPRPHFTATPAWGAPPLNVALDASRSSDADGTIALFEWTLGDGFTAAGKTASHSYGSPGEYSVTLRITDDGGATAAVSQVVTVVDGLPAPNQRPGDLSQDGKVDITDAIGVLGHLFRGAPAVLPCGDGTGLDRGNLLLLDANGDGGLDLSDAVYLLFALYAGGAPHVLGEECVLIAGCPGACP